MGVVRIDALCMCEGCAKRFGIAIDLSEELEDYLDFEELARETIRGGQFDAYTWTVERYPLACLPTIQGDYMLCDVCSKTCDDLPIERNLTRREVERALGLMSETDN